MQELKTKIKQLSEFLALVATKDVPSKQDIATIELNAHLICLIYKNHKNPNPSET